LLIEAGKPIEEDWQQDTIGGWTIQLLIDMCRITCWLIEVGNTIQLMVLQGGWSVLLFIEVGKIEWRLIELDNKIQLILLQRGLECTAVDRGEQDRMAADRIGQQVQLLLIEVGTIE
jgi:hypothetical protein